MESHLERIRFKVLAIGNELLSGAVVDTNTAFLARTLSPLGFSLVKGALLPDIIGEIAAAVRAEAEGCDALFTTGGLGPTSDDLTRQAIAQVAAVPLEENASARTKLEELLKKRNRSVNENNLRQVSFPRGAAVILNRSGTADAFCTEISRRDGSTIPLYSLPGIPRETEIIVREEIVPALTKRFPVTLGAPIKCTLRCFGYSESHLGQLIEGANVPDVIDIGYRPIFPEILLTLTHIGPRVHGAAEDHRIDELRLAKEQVINAIGPAHIISENGDDTMATVVSTLLRERAVRFASAESCSGGQLANMIVAVPGASEFFLGSAVTYSNEAKSVLAGVRPAVLARYGAVSAEVAIELARGCLYRLGADIAVSITGVAGPNGGSEEKPIGTFWVGLVTPTSEEAFPQFYPTERNMFRRFCATLALDLVRRKLLGLPLVWERR